MKQFVAIITLCLLFSSFTIGCERASLNRIGKDVYYVQIQGEGTIEKLKVKLKKLHTACL